MLNLLKEFNIDDNVLGGFSGNWFASGSKISVISPINGKKIHDVIGVSKDEVNTIIEKSHEAFMEWRKIPAPKRGEVIRQLGLELRNYKNDLAELVTLEMGKSLQESKGEVQEMIDICDFATGLSRHLTSA